MIRFTSNADIHAASRWEENTSIPLAVGHHIVDNRGITYEICAITHNFKGDSIVELTPFFNGRTPANYDCKTGKFK